MSYIANSHLSLSLSLSLTLLLGNAGNRFLYYDKDQAINIDTSERIFSDHCLFIVLFVSNNESEGHSLDSLFLLLSMDVFVKSLLLRIPTLLLDIIEC